MDYEQVGRQKKHVLTPEEKFAKSLFLSHSAPVFAAGQARCHVGLKEKVD